MPAPSRAVCDRCRRPASVCYCAHIPELPTRTRVILLQHPRERHVAIGTARMAHLALPNSVLRLGLDFSDDEVVAAALAASPPPFLLFPGPNARDASELPQDRPVTLVVLDGTWSQARKLRRLTPALGALPQVAFSPRRPSAYRIRRQPAAFCVSTIEALAEVLPLLEPGRPSFERLLDPFHAMIARQEQFATEIASARHRRPEARSAASGSTSQSGGLSAPRSAADFAAELVSSWPRLVCVYGEANAWPKRMRDRPAPEIVRWLGHRPATGAVYQAIVAPRQPLAPAVPARIGISAEALQAGSSVADWQRSWAEFCGPDDVLVTWGPFDVGLAKGDGLDLPARVLDLRPQAPRSSRERFRTVEEAAAALGAAPAGSSGLADVVSGRGGRRLAALGDVLAALACPVPESSATTDGKAAPDPLPIAV